MASAEIPLQTTPALEEQPLAAAAKESGEESPESGETALAEALKEEEERAALTLHPAAARLPVELDVSVAVHRFRVRNLLALEKGQIVETRWSHGQDLPLAAGKQILAWAEFEVLETALGVRITHLA